MASVGQQLLVQYITALNTNPLRTKMLTSGFLAALAEVLAGKFAGVAPATKKTPPGQVSEKKAVQQQPIRMAQATLESIGINKKALQMFIYGFGISAPLGHVMTGACCMRKDVDLSTFHSRLTMLLTSLSLQVFCSEPLLARRRPGIECCKSSLPTSLSQSLVIWVSLAMSIVGSVSL